MQAFFLTFKALPKMSGTVFGLATRFTRFLAPTKWPDVMDGTLTTLWTEMASGVATGMYVICSLPMILFLLTPHL